MQIMKKMSVGGMNEIRGGFKDVDVTKFVARIIGFARSVETKVTTIGESLCFKGEFRGTNADGELFSAAVCYLVSPADEMLAQALSQPENVGKEVKFGFDFFVTPKEKRTPVDLGYSYQVKPLLDTAPTDAMAALMGNIAAPLPVTAKQSELPGVAEKAALPAPEPEPVTVPSKESEQKAAQAKKK